MWSVIRENRQPMTAHEVATYGRSYDALAGLMLSDFKF